MNGKRWTGAAVGLALLAGTLAPLAGLAQEASPVAESPTVPFCGMQDGGGLDRAMTQAELDAYFAGGLPTFSWYPSERGCAGDTPFVSFDEAGTFLGFLEPAAPEAPPAEEAAQPAAPETPSEPAATSEPAAPAEQPVSDALATPPAEQAPEGEQPDAVQNVEAIATSIPEPTPTPTVAEQWASREGKIAVCVLTFEDPVHAEWMTPAEYERFAAEWEQVGNDGGLSPYGLIDIVGFGDMTNFGACTTENGVLVNPDAPAVCRTVGPNGERIPVSILPVYARYGQYSWDDIPDTTGRCPGDPRWTEIGPRINHSWMVKPPIGQPQEVADAEAVRIAEINRLQATGEIGDFYFPPNEENYWRSEVTLDAASKDYFGAKPTCLQFAWGHIATYWLTDEQAADLAAETDAVIRSSVSKVGPLAILGPGDLSNFGSCATENGAIKPFDPERFELTCDVAMLDDGSRVSYVNLRNANARGSARQEVGPDPVTGACPPPNPTGGPQSMYDAPALPENIVVYGGV